MLTHRGRSAETTNEDEDDAAADAPFPIPAGAVTTRRRRLRRGWLHPLRGTSMLTKAVSALVGMALVAGGAYAASNWAVGLATGSSGEAQSGTVSNLTITAVASPAATNVLFPGGTGDVVATIANPNPFPVSVTGVDLPTNATYAGGFTTSALSTAQTGCSSTTSDVAWNYATGTSGSVHTLTSALVVAASGSLTVTFTNDAQMTTGSPSACEGTFFSMPSLTGVVATGGSGTATTSPATDAWTS